MAARLVWDQEVAGSRPATPTARGTRPGKASESPVPAGLVALAGDELADGAAPMFGTRLRVDDRAAPVTLQRGDSRSTRDRRRRSWPRIHSTRRRKPAGPAKSCRRPGRDRDTTPAPLIGVWLSLVEHPAGGRTVIGSNPVTPTVHEIQYRHGSGPARVHARIPETVDGKPQGQGGRASRRQMCLVRLNRPPGDRSHQASPGLWVHQPGRRYVVMVVGPDRSRAGQVLAALPRVPPSEDP